jgi:hypothetical protein
LDSIVAVERRYLVPQYPLLLIPSVAKDIEGTIQQPQGAPWLADGRAHSYNTGKHQQ